MKKISGILFGLALLFSWWGYVVSQNKLNSTYRDVATSEPKPPSEKLTAVCDPQVETCPKN